MQNGSNRKDHPLPTILVTLLALLMIASPLVQWWSSAESPWYTPYLLWSGVIVLIALLNHRRSNHVR